MISLGIRLAMATVCGVGCLRLAMAEIEYAQGMASRRAQSAIDHLTAAGGWYPWAFTFRTAQAMNLYKLAGRHAGAAPAAAESLRLAFIVDPASAELASKLHGAQLALGRCDEAKVTAAAMLRLAPKSEKAQILAAKSCGGER